MRREAGFVLVNALVLVAAMAAAAVFVMARAEDGRAQLSAAQQAARLRMGLDAFEANAQAMLNRDALRGPVDGLDDSWAQPLTQVAFDGVTVSGRIVDQQGLFNVNWLAEEGQSRAGFARMLAELGLSAQLGGRIADHVSDDGPANTRAFGRGDPAMVPRGGPVLMMDQLTALPGISPDELAQLRGFATALPRATALNVNTAPEEVLRAMLPQLSTARINALLQRRAEAPFESVDALIEELEIETDIEENPDAVDPARLAVASIWFGGRAQAQSGKAQATREVLFLRRGRAQADWRVTRFGAD